MNTGVGSRNKNKTTRKIFLGRLAAFIAPAIFTMSLMQGCGDKGHQNQNNRYPETSVATEFLSESELTKLLNFAGTKLGLLGIEYSTYSWQVSNQLSRDMLMDRVEARMKGFPELFVSTEKVFKEWREKGYEHEMVLGYKGLDNINVAILGDYLDKKYNGADIGIKYGLTNQDLATLIVKTKGNRRLFHQSIVEHTMDMKRDD